MTSITCLVATLLAILSIPFVLLLWVTESRSTRINRLRSNGYTWKTIATRYGVSPSTVRRWAVG